MIVFLNSFKQSALSSPVLCDVTIDEKINNCYAPLFYIDKTGSLMSFTRSATGNFSGEIMARFSFFWL